MKRSDKGGTDSVCGLMRELERETRAKATIRPGGSLSRPLPKSSNLRTDKQARPYGFIQ